MAGSGDLVGGGYPLGYSFRKAVGLASNASQTNLGVRSNLEWFGVNALTDAAAALTTADITLVAVPVEIGDEISSVSFAVGNTPGSTLTHQWGALYSGVLTTAGLLGQSIDSATATITASALVTYTFATPVIITPTNAPYGYVYAGMDVTGTVPSLSSVTVATVVQYARFTDAPPFWAGKIAATGGTAAATITLASVAALATIPEAYLY